MSVAATPLDLAILARIGQFVGYLYRPAGKNPLIEPLPSGCLVVPSRVVRQRGESRFTDCSTFAGLGVVGALPGRWDAAAAMDLAVGDAARPYSPIECVVRCLVGREVGAPVADRWHLVQAWRAVDSAGVPELAAGGHAFLWFGGEVGTKYHASSSAGRVLAEDATWADQRKRYQGLRLAVLG